MSYYSEQDPLLPNDKPAPEIQGSRPQSLNDDSDEELEDTGKLRQKRFDDLTTSITGLVVPVIFTVAVLVILLLPGGVLRGIWGDGWWPGPQTIEERVNRILTDTPLIGISYGP